MASRLKKLLTDGQVIEGTLTRVTVGSAAHYQLTSKERGKTKTVYVPLCAKQEVEQWARRWKEAKALLKGLSDCSRSILASSAPGKRKTGGRSSTPSGGVPRRSSRTLGEREKRRYVLEARIVTPWGWNIPVMSEPVDSYDGEREKQDCEMNAFKRLASRLKKAFPRQGFCIIGDALYACSPVIDICEKYGWDYILVFKEGSAPKRYRHAHAALAGKDRKRPIMGRAEDGTEQLWGRVEWVDASEIRQSTGEEFRGAVVACRQWYPFESCYDGEFVTSFPVNDGVRAELIACWGRRRWNIENGFNAQKNDGFGADGPVRRMSREHLIL